MRTSGKINYIYIYTEVQPLGKCKYPAGLPEKTRLGGDTEGWRHGARSHAAAVRV